MSTTGGVRLSARRRDRRLVFQVFNARKDENDTTRCEWPMSVGCMIEVFRNSKSSGNDRLVLLAIADEADDEGRNAFPSVRRLAAKANCHTETVTESLKRLEALGELEVTRPERQGRGRFNRYKVLLAGMSGNSDPSDRGLVMGSVMGSARTGPRQSDEQSAPKWDLPRAISQPQGSFQPERHECDECVGSWVELDDGSVAQCRNAG